MKNNVLKLGVLAFTIVAFVSCKDEKKEEAEKKVDTYVTYVDSLETISAADAKANWKTIEANYEMRTTETQNAIAELKENAKEQEKIDASKQKYEAMKAKMQAEMDAETVAANTKKDVAVKSNPNQILRDRLFGAGKIGEDMSFAWVNKDNILKVYENFFQSYKDSKSKFTREDYDEVKMMYEALDSRKNTVEKEGLTSADNMKIASIKFKFAPMFKINRIGAKTRENEKAKE
ncbi:MAG: hypothetical protein H7239_10895 [Flavobacterium sp.]|nr:hypothetical protein [Flavobacterium sp.]